MSSDRLTIEIDSRRYNKENLAMLLGLEEEDMLQGLTKKGSISPDILNIAWVLDRPTRLPIVLKDIYAIEQADNEVVRLALARAQIDAALNLNENLQKYTKQKYVAETIEKLIFGELLLEGKSKKGNGNNNSGKSAVRKVPVKKGKTTGKKQTTTKKKK